MTSIRPSSLGLLRKAQEDAQRAREDVGVISPRMPVLRPAPAPREPERVPRIEPQAGDALPEGEKVRRKVSQSARQARKTKPEKIGRQLKGPSEALDPSSSPGLLEARFDAGVFFHYDLEWALARELVVQDTLRVQVTVAGANGRDTVTLDVGSDYIIQHVNFVSLANFANIERWSLFHRQITDPRESFLFVSPDPPTSLTVTEDAGTRALLLPAEFPRATLPMFIREESEVILALDTDAGGGAQIAVDVQITRTPDGVRIPA